MSGNTRKNQVTRLVTLRHRSIMSGALSLSWPTNIKFHAARVQLRDPAAKLFGPWTRKSPPSVKPLDELTGSPTEPRSRLGPIRRPERLMQTSGFQQRRRCQEPVP